MRFLSTLVVSALAAFVAATPQPQSSSAASSTTTASGPNAFNVPSGGYDLKAGSPTTFTWDPTTQGTVTLQLRSGNSGTLSSGTTIASSIPNAGSFTYTPPSDIQNGGDYTIEIISDSDSSQVNYTPQFPIVSDNNVSSASASGSSASASATSASASGSSASASATSAAASSTAASSTAAASSAAASSTGAASSTAAASSEASQTAAATSAPTSGAQPGLKVQGGLLALLMGAGAVAAL